MNKKRLLIILLFRIVSFTNISMGQSQNIGRTVFDLVQKDSAALLNVEKIIEGNSSHFEALLQASKLASNLGGTTINLVQRAIYIDKAALYAERSIRVQPNSKEAHLNYIIALGLLSGWATSPSEKLRNAQIIKCEADYLLSIDSLYPAAYFALGKWHLSLASLTWLERTACDVLFGGMPKEASLETALLCFERAIRLNPDYILFHYNKALALIKLNRYDQAVESLKYGLQLPIQDKNDAIRKNSCTVLLNQIKLKSSQ